jgi:O-acetyl-ADP-ribose deacetylase (regulator of RNase III)
LPHTDDTITGQKKDFPRSHMMTTVVASQKLASGQILRLIHGDLTKEKVDAIVNAANAQLAHGGGVAGAIVRAGGREIQTESDAWVREHGLVSHQRPAITSAGRLPCRYVIHAVGPIWGEGDEDAKLRSAVTGALALADEKALTSLALPAISTGIFGFPKERGARVILDAIVDYFEQKPDSSLSEVHVTLIDEPSVAIFADEFNRRWSGNVKQG